MGRSPPPRPRTYREPRPSTIRVRTAPPERAAEAANAYAEAYIQQSGGDKADQLEADAATREGYAADVQLQINELDAQIADPNNLITAESAAAEREAMVVDRDRSRADANNLEAQAAEIRTGFRVLQAATTPGSPVEPRPLRAAAAAAAAALLLGGGAGLALELRDDTIRSEADLEQLNHPTPILARIPWRKPDSISFETEPSLVGEAYVALAFVAARDPWEILTITSPSPADGKSTVASHLAWSFATEGDNILLVEGDLHRPRLAELFGISRERPGLRDIVNGSASPASALVEIETDSPGSLRILSAGSRGASLAAVTVADTIDKLQTEGEDRIIVDSPPLLAVADGLAFADTSGAVVMVARLGHTRLGELDEAIDLLEKANLPLVGLVLVGVPEDRNGRYSAYYESEA